MRIAVIGWGSLLWKPGCLQVREGEKWQKDGPCLSLEFARKSRDGRLTLVLVPGVKAQQTYWIPHQSTCLIEARDDLRMREGCPTLNPIHSVCRHAGCKSESDSEFSKIIREWLDSTNHADAAIWTGLGPTVEGASKESALKYLRDLDDAKRALAEEYVRKAPPQIETPYRIIFREDLGWKNIELTDPDFWNDKIAK